VRDAPVSPSLGDSRWVRYAEAAVRVENGALRAGARLASIRGSLAADRTHY